MILPVDEMQRALAGGIGLCRSEMVSFDGRRRPVAALWREGEEIWFEGIETSVRTHIPLSLLQSARGQITIAGVGMITISRGTSRTFEEVRA